MFWIETISRLWSALRIKKRASRRLSVWKAHTIREFEFWGSWRLPQFSPFGGSRGDQSRTPQSEGYLHPQKGRDAAGKSGREESSPAKCPKRSGRRGAERSGATSGGKPWARAKASPIPLLAPIKIGEAPTLRLKGARRFLETRGSLQAQSESEIPRGWSDKRSPLGLSDRVKLLAERRTETLSRVGVTRRL